MELTDKKKYMFLTEHLEWKFREETIFEQQLKKKLLIYQSTSWAFDVVRELSAQNKTESVKGLAPK